MATQLAEELSPEQNLALLTDAVWRQMGGHIDQCPPEKIPTFRQLDDLISTTAWGEDARREFFLRWIRVENASDKSFEVNSFAQLAHLTWAEVCKTDAEVKHPLAPLIHAWHSGPAEVQPVRDADGNLRGDTIAPRIAMLDGGGRTKRLYLPPAHFSLEGESGQMVMPGLGDGNSTSRIPSLPVELYDLGVKAGEARGGYGGAPIPARMLVKLAAAPSTSVRHGSRFVTYKITLRDLRDALYPPVRLDGSNRRQRSVAYMWPRVWQAIRIINNQARIPILDPETGYGHYHHLLRINENFGRIDLDMPIGIVLDIPPEVEGGVKLPHRLDQWGAESAPAYRALIGLSFLWHEPGRTHAPVAGKWLRKKGLDPYVLEHNFASAYHPLEHIACRDTSECGNNRFFGLILNLRIPPHLIAPAQALREIMHTETHSGSFIKTQSRSRHFTSIDTVEETPPLLPFQPAGQWQKQQLLDCL